MRSAARHLPALVLFAVLTGVLAFPLVASLGTAVPGWEGDNLYYVRATWWMKHALLDLGVSPFFDPTAYYPVGQPTGRSDMSAANTVLALPVTAVFGPVVAYNVVLLFSFVATGFFTYLWVGRLTGRRSAGLLAGTIAAFLPLRFAHLVGHLTQVTTQWVPFSLWAFERFLERHTLRRATLLGLGVGLVALGCWYYGYGLALLLPVYGLLRTWPDRAVWRRPAWWMGILAGAAVALVLVLPFLVPMARLHEGGQLRRSLAEMDSWSVNPYDFFLPNLAHPVWGQTASAAFPRQRGQWVERGLSLGTVAVLTGLVGLLWGRPRRAVAALAAVWLVSYLIALGPTLRWRDEPVRVGVPAPVGDAVGRALAAAGLPPPAGEQGRDVPVPLPSLALYLFVPLTASMRVMARFGFWTGLMTAGLAGWGLVKLLEVGERRFGPAARGAIPTALIAAVAFESLTVIPMLPTVPRPVDVWLAARPGNPVVAELPVVQAARSFQNFWATTRGCADLFGWRGDSFPSPLERERWQALQGFPSAESLAFLKASAATHVLVTPGLVPGWEGTRASPDVAAALRLEEVVGEVHVYRVVR